MTYRKMHKLTFQASGLGPHPRLTLTHINEHLCCLTWPSARATSFWRRRVSRRGPSSARPCAGRASSGLPGARRPSSTDTELECSTCGAVSPPEIRKVLRRTRERGGSSENYTKYILVVGLGIWGIWDVCVFLFVYLLLFCVFVFYSRAFGCRCLSQ